MSHRDAVFEPPPGIHRARLQPRLAGRRVREPERGLYGIQFHPEVVHTPYGTEILTRFLREVAGLPEQWSPAVGDRRAGRDDQGPGGRGR